MTDGSSSPIPGPGSRLPRIVRLIGLAIVCLSVVFLARSLLANGLKLASSEIESASAPWIVLGGLLFAGNHLTNSAAWILILRQLGERLDARALVGIGLTSQIGKYAPGNIAHQIGRATLAKARGISVKTVAWSALVEAIGAALACAMIAGMVAVAAPQSFASTLHLGGAADMLPSLGALAVILGLAAVLLGPAVTRRVLPAAPRVTAGAAVAVTGCYIAGYALAGGSFYAVASALGVRDFGLLPAIGVYSAAWFIGFVTPGAPAGLGVREAILVALLSTSADPALAVTAAICHRVLTAVVDGIAFLAGAAMLARGSAVARR